MRRRTKPGPKPRRKTLNEIDDILLTINQLGQCLGKSYKSTKTILLENNIPIVKTGTGVTIHRAVAERVISGELWLDKCSGAEGRAAQ